MRDLGGILMKKILFTASEAAPFIKVGGLGDVAGALPKALCEQDADVRIVLPLYSKIPEILRRDMEFITYFYFPLAWRSAYCGIFRANVGGVTYYLIDNEQYFARKNVYGEYDDAERFSFFSHAVLEMLPYIDFYPEIIHANDWHTALIPPLLDFCFRDRAGYENIKTVFSIHNIEFQGKYGMDLLGDIFGLPGEAFGVMCYDNCLNLMKGAIESANMVTTVSERYAAEIMDPYYSFGLHNILMPRSFKLRGIVNGIDTSLFDPQTDPNIRSHYSADDLCGKSFDKVFLKQELGLSEENKPLFIMITRLTPQKGINLLMPVIDELMNSGIQMAVLGTGYPEYEEFLREVERKYPGNFKAVIDFSAPLAQKLYAGGDFLLMPSKFEPCGLAQLIALRYATVPVVRETGGLADTVVPYNSLTKEGNGITFKTFNAHDMKDAVLRAAAIYANKADMKEIKKNGVSGDYSWGKSAEKYMQIYADL